MKITFLGTAAAEGLPAVWCNCPVCRTAREYGGRDVRTRSQILIDSAVLVDFPMDTYMHALAHKLDLSGIDTVLITHAHMDHCYPQEFMLHGAPFAHDMTAPEITIHGDKAVRETFLASVKAEMREEIRESVPFTVCEPYSQFTTDSGYEVFAFPACHTEGEDCLIYAVCKDGKTALFFNDSGILSEEVYARMAQAGLKFDLVSFDCTYGHMRHGSGRHMGSLDAFDEKEKMRAHGLIHSHTKYILTHFSHNCGLSYDELCATEEENGFIVAYDGMTILI